MGEYRFASLQQIPAQGTCMADTRYLTQKLPISEALKPHFTKALLMNCFPVSSEASNSEKLSDYWLWGQRGREDAAAHFTCCNFLVFQGLLWGQTQNSLRCCHTGQTSGDNTTKDPPSSPGRAPTQTKQGANRHPPIHSLCVVCLIPGTYISSLE